MEMYQGKIGLTWDELTEGDDPIVKPNTLKSRLRRGTTRYLRRGRGRGIAALVEYESLPGAERKEWVRRHGDPYAATRDPRTIPADLVLEEDAAARRYYTYEYTYEDRGQQLHLADNLVDEYTLNATCLSALIRKRKQMKLLGRAHGNRRGSLASELLAYSERLRKEYGHTLPTSEKRLMGKLRRYEQKGYSSLISGKVGNTNRDKITPEVGEYLIGLKRSRLPRYSYVQAWRKYNAECEARGWAPIESLSTIRDYLDSPRIRPLWLDVAIGEVRAHQQLGLKLHTKLPSLPNALWYGDGTRLNLYYVTRGERGGAELHTVDVYMVLDAATECWIGWAYGEEASEETQYPAYRMALLRAGVRPYEIVVDNQSGHKKLDRQGFFRRISEHFRTTTPYRAQAKSIEQVFGRFQGEILGRFPWFTGRNITSRGEELKPDAEWIRANADLLPQSLSELRAQYEACIEEWNGRPCSTDAFRGTGLSRREAYDETPNPSLLTLDRYALAEILWVETQRPILFTDSGLEMTVRGERRWYDVYTEEGYIDTEWRMAHRGERFIVKYDPVDRTTIALYSVERDGSRRFVRWAEPAVVVARALQERTERDDALTYGSLDRDKRQRMERIARGRAIDLRQGNADQVYPRVPGLSEGEEEWITARAWQIAGIASRSTREPIERRSTKLSLELGRVLKEESKLDTILDSPTEDHSGDSGNTAKRVAERY